MDNDESLAIVLGDIPRNVDRLIVLYPCSEGQTACRWFGMSAEQVASTLYQMADGVVEQRVPLKPWRTAWDAGAGKGGSGCSDSGNG